MITKLDPGRYYFEYGPTQMVISATRGQDPLDKEIISSAGYAKELLTVLSSNLQLIKGGLPVKDLPEDTSPIIKNMIESVELTGDHTLTPMAAVAGVIADEIADNIFATGATKVFVNNGGDIALRMVGGESIKIGINSSLKQPSLYQYILIVHGSDNIGGIASSGLGGRGFTKGIASAATVLAPNGGIADACATLIGNYTSCNHPAIIKVLAEQIDPDTDIKGHFVTVGVNNDDPEIFKTALQNGLHKARQLVDSKLILGALIFTGPFGSVYPDTLTLKIQEPKQI